jgi:glycerol-3-phosphate acyltransferase PlsX
LDYREFGGGPLLGVNGIVIVAHGRSDAYAIRNAIRVAKQAAEKNIVGVIERGLSEATSQQANEPTNQRVGETR